MIMNMKRRRGTRTLIWAVMPFTIPEEFPTYFIAQAADKGGVKQEGETGLLQFQTSHFSLCCIIVLISYTKFTKKKKVFLLEFFVLNNYDLIK